MQIIGLGKINVPTSGTKVAFSATSLKVRKVIVSFDPADTVAIVHIKDAAGTIIGSLALGNPSFVLGSCDGNPLDLSTLFADASANNKGPNVGYVLG